MPSNERGSLKGEELIPLSLGPESWPKEARPSYDTIKRYCRTGTRGIVLESVLLVGKLYTSRPAIQRFLEQTGGAIK